MKAFLLLFLIYFMPVQGIAQKDNADSGSAIVSKKMRPKKSNLIFVDSVRLKNDLFRYERLNHFIRRNSDSINSFFVWSPSFFYFRNRLAISHERITNEFDSIAASFVYDQFLDYKFIERKGSGKRSTPYEINLVLILSIAERSVYIGISEPYKLMFFEKKYYFDEFL